MYSAIVSMSTYVPYQNVKNAVPKCMYLYVPGTYHFTTLKFVPGTYYLSKVCTRKHTFNAKYVLVHTGIYQYTLEVKNMYLVHTWGKSINLVQTGLCPFIWVPCHSMVHTGTYRYILV